MTKKSTATLKFILPFETKYIQKATIVVQDYKNPTMFTIKKQLGECEVQQYWLRTTLSSEDMNNFKDYAKLKIQLFVTFTDGSKQSSECFYKTVKEIIDNEVE